MVHSGSSSPMKTTSTSSASTHLTSSVPAATAALAPPSGEDLDTHHTATKLLPDLTSKSDFTQPSTLTTAAVVSETLVVTQGKGLATDASTLAQTWSSTNTNTPQTLVNGRTSGRKRTPKACDCCGPNGKGHNVKTPGQARGRGGRGRGRGSVAASSSDLWDATPKRKMVVSQFTQIKSLDLTNEKKAAAEKTVQDESGLESERFEKLETPLKVTQSQSQMPVAIPPKDGPIRNSETPKKGGVLKNEDMFMDNGTGGVAIEGEKGAGDSSNVESRLSIGSPVVHGGGRRIVGVSKMDFESGFKKGVIGLKTYGLPRVLSLQKPVPNKDLRMGMYHAAEQQQQTDLASVKKAPIVNGDTVNLSDTEPEEDNMITTSNSMENGVLSISLLPGEFPLDVDADMQVDQTPSVSLVPGTTLSNGNLNIPTPETTNDDHSHTTPMQIEHSNSATVAPDSEGPIAMCITEHPKALRDHRLYCQPGTWESEKMDGVMEKERETDATTQSEGSREQLIDMVHEFLENFYLKYGGFVPLSETDVLEHLKQKGNLKDLSNRGVDVKGEMSRYRAALASAPMAGFMVTYNKHTLSLEDLGTLEEQNWLNDQIINMYGELIMEATQHKVHFFNSFFHKQLVAKGYDGVKRWTKKVDLFSKWLLLIPIHLEIHWSLITVAMATKTISYYDSQGIVFRHTTDNIMKYLLSEAREKNQTAFQKGWKIAIIKGIPQQKNDSDCGVFVLEYCRCLSVKQPLRFSQDDMPRIRKRIYKELCDCGLNG